MACSSSLVLLVLLPFAVGCGAAPSETVDAVRFDPCEPLAVVLEPGATIEQQLGVRAAAELWNQAALTRLSVTTSPSPLENAGIHLRFQAAAPPSHGFFDPSTGRVLINDDLADHALAVTIAHELGHAFALVHVGDRASVMTAGNLDVVPNEGDVVALTRQWGGCSSR